MSSAMYVDCLNHCTAANYTLSRKAGRGRVSFTSDSLTEVTVITVPIAPLSLVDHGSLLKRPLKGMGEKTVLANVVS